MDFSNSIPENGKKEGEIGSATFNIKVIHGPNEHEVAVPSNSRFGDLKLVIVKKIGLKPEMHKLLFRGKEKEDDEDLHTAGVKDNSKVLLIEDKAWTQDSPGVVKQTNVVSRGVSAVAEVRKEVDKLLEQVSALQAGISRGTKVDDKYVLHLTEMLMRQLLKLDSIEAEGEGKVQRKMEVRRVQSIVETMDLLKSRNSSPYSNVNDNPVAVTTQWETFESGPGSVPGASPAPADSTPEPIHSPTFINSSTPIITPSSSPAKAGSTPELIHTPTLINSSTPIITPSSSPSPGQSSVHNQMMSVVSSPAQLHSTPTQRQSSVPASVQFSAPYMSSSTKVTQDWEHFD